MLASARSCLSIGLLASLFPTIVSAEPPPQSKTGQQAAVEFFEKKIRPVLVEHCYQCHSAKSKAVKGGLLLDTRAGLRKGGESGPALVPGKAQASLLLNAIRYNDLEMPPSGRLPANVIADFERWIKSGAVDPREGPAAPKASGVDLKAGLKFWAFQPPVYSKIPRVQRNDWPRTAIDRFVLARLEQAELEPVAAADRATLIRRASFGLIGLPPTPAEVEQFVNDQSPNAFEKVADRLLASPHYGERWGRHWLDVARYAEDQAHTFKARTYPRSFRYRDWVVKALNDDMPYDQFIKAQIAGDLLRQPNRHERIAALGFFALGPVYYQDNGEQAQALADEWDDRVDTLARGVLGLTVACARCHDHKYDPITMEDYYGLAGVFASSAYQERPVVAADVVARRQQADEKVNLQQLTVDRFLAVESRKLRPALAGEISIYMVAAWKTQNKLKPNPKDKKKLTSRIAKQEKTSEFLLARWIDYLFDVQQAERRPWLKDWHKLIASQDARRDLSDDVAAIAAVKQTAQAFQALVQSKLPGREQLFAQFGESIAFVDEADRAIIVPGVIPLGNLFDDSAGTSLDAAVASDRFKANAGNNSLGVDRVSYGLGLSTGIAPDISFDFRQLGGNNSKYGKVTNDGWNSTGGLQTSGKKIVESGKRMEQGIGMHANALITFDLDEIRKAGLMPVNQEFVFRADRAGLNDDVAGSDAASAHLAVLVSARQKKNNVFDAVIAGYVNGRAVKVSENDTVYFFSGRIPAPLQADGRFVAFEVPILPQAKYLTLISTGAAKDTDENSINSDHAVFSGARLEQNPLPAAVAISDIAPANDELTNDASDKADAVLLSELLYDEGLLAIPAAEAAAKLTGRSKQESDRLQRELDLLKKTAAGIDVAMAHSLTEGPASDLRIFWQGNPEKPGELAPRSLLAVLTNGKRVPFKSRGSGRLELAHAISSRDNPLTARVIVNRVWQHHFGFGLIRTPSNFGALGERPTHPQLLDYLALRFMDFGWSLKALHREILLSATYQLSSRDDERNLKTDPANRLLWRMNRRQLEVEPWRDAMLAVAGQLDCTQGGPSIDLASSGNRRRTLYGRISRHKLNDLLRLFDFPDPNITSGARSVTTVPLQLLFVMNSEFIVARAKALAARLASEIPPANANGDRIRRAYLLLYSRPVNQRELQFGLEFLAAASKEKQTEGHLSAWEQYALALLGANEFAYID